MRRALLFAVPLLAACSNAPDVIWLGQFESPCISASDCNGQPCLMVDGFSACTSTCYARSQECGQGYACDVELMACAPRPGGECRDGYVRCGPSFPPCCSGSACVDFGEWGARCAPVRCRHDDDCRPGFCCIDAGSENVCAPPTYCGG